VSAVIQDETAAILLRIGDEVGPLARGDRVEVAGVRSTLAGMETLRVTGPALRLGSMTEPDPVMVRTGEAGEALEAQLIRVRGALVASARRAATGTVSFELDDGSGPLRVYLAAALSAETAGLVAGAWVEATGVLGQETTGAQPLRGYRVWPRAAGEVVAGASPTGASDAATASTSSAGGQPAIAGSAAPGASLAEIGAPDLASLHVGATLVHGPWPDLKVAGLLWDGDRLVAVASSSERTVRGVLGGLRAPIPLQLTGLVAGGREPASGVPIVVLGKMPGAVVVRQGPPHPPATMLPDSSAAWVALVGRLTGPVDDPRLDLPDASVPVSIRCERPEPLPRGIVQLTGMRRILPRVHVLSVG
jgi:hypothetical protein